MDLEDELKDLQEQLAAADGKQNEPEVVEEEVIDEPDPKDDEPAKEEEPEVLEKPTDDPEKPLDDAGYARLRREAAQARKEAKEAKEALVAAQRHVPQQTQPVQQQTTNEPEKNPYNPDTDIEAHLRWEIADTQKKLQQVAGYIQNTAKQQETANLETGALGEIDQHFQNYVKKNPDFSDAKDFVTDELRKSYRRAGVPANQIDGLINKRLIKVSAEAVYAGQDVGEALADWAMTELDYKPKQKGNTPVREAYPNLERVAANKQRNAGMAGGHGRGGSASKSLSSFAETGLDVAAWESLSDAEKRAILNEANQVA